MTNYAFCIYGQSNAELISPALTAALIAQYGPQTRVLNSWRGNTAIADMSKGTDLYNAMLTQMLQAKADGYVVAKFFFWQGETDARLGLSAAWPAAATQLIYDLRTDSGTFPQIIFFQIAGPPFRDPPDQVLYDNWRTFQHMQLDFWFAHTGYKMAITNELLEISGTPHLIDYTKAVKRAMEFATE